MPQKSNSSVVDTNSEPYHAYEVEEFTIDEEPYYLPIQDEIEVFTAAYEQKIPVLLSEERK